MCILNQSIFYFAAYECVYNTIIEYSICNSSKPNSNSKNNNIVVSRTRDVGDTVYRTTADSFTENRFSTSTLDHSTMFQL